MCIRTSVCLNQFGPKFFMCHYCSCMGKVASYIGVTDMVLFSVLLIDKS